MKLAHNSFLARTINGVSVDDTLSHDAWVDLTILSIATVAGAVSILCAVFFTLTISR